MKLAIFDLDDTLIDFAATRRVACMHLTQRLDQAGLDSAGFMAVFPSLDRELFSRFERGELTREAYRLRRFADPLVRIGVNDAGGLVQELNRIFMDCVNDAPLLFEDAKPVLARLQQEGVATAILTNGPSDGQRRKLRATGLDGMVDWIAIGEETGHSKPLVLAYRTVVQRFSLEPGQALMVGDSPELDYDGAQRAGLQALLVDRDARHAGSGRDTIDSLSRLPGCGPLPQ
jgi:putative hydrolase of the HAD superfamily